MCATSCIPLMYCRRLEFEGRLAERSTFLHQINFSWLTQPPETNSLLLPLLSLSHPHAQLTYMYIQPPLHSETTLEITVIKGIAPPPDLPHPITQKYVHVHVQSYIHVLFLWKVKNSKEILKADCYLLAKAL